MPERKKTRRDPEWLAGAVAELDVVEIIGGDVRGSAAMGVLEWIKKSGY